MLTPRLTPEQIIARSERLDYHGVPCDRCAGTGELEPTVRSVMDGKPLFCEKCGGAGTIAIPARERRIFARAFVAGAVETLLLVMVAAILPEPYGLLVNLGIGGIIGWNWRRIVRWLS